MRVALTGATGSLGRAIIARLAQDGADRIVGCSRDEHKRAQLQAEFSWHPHVRIFAGDIRDERRLVDLFAGCECVVHCAARKIVSGHFDEPREMVATNLLGTMNVLQAARSAGVRKLLFISSDKAVHANNPQPYGLSKALAETLVISENARCFAAGLRCGVLRYGNVLSSNGSVVKVWRALAVRGEPLPISDRRMTRFWLTLDQAVTYVLRAIGDLRGGEIFVPWLKAAPVTRLLEAVAPQAETTEIGIRPGGEKLHETLVSEDEIRRARRRNDWIIVPPTDTSELWDRSSWLGELVPADFRYHSKTWPEQWTVEELREALGITQSEFVASSETS